MARYALVNAGGLTESFVVWDGQSDYQPPPGYTLVDEAEAPALVPPPPPPTPQAVTNFQARALMAATILPDGRSLEAAVNQMLAAALHDTAELPDADPARIHARRNWLAWEQSNEFSRGGALVTAIGSALGFSDAELDAMFRDAAGIEA